ncbi:MAG: 50S ribosomal protein L13 [Dehalococcoidia bacterium]
MKTYSAKPSEMEPLWHVMDATGRPLGRLAVEVARILQGKHRPTYTAHILTGDFVVIVNASQVGITGRKSEQKKYYRHSGYPGGLRTTTYKQMLDNHPDRIVRQAVKGMLPKNALARHMLKRLKVYAGADHPHEAQVTGALRRQAGSDQEQKSEE